MNQKSYLYYKLDKEKYYSYRGNQLRQIIIRNSDEPKYYVVKGHPKFKNDHGRNDDNRYENDNGNDNRKKNSKEKHHDKD